MLLELSREYLRPAMVMSLLTVWLLVGLFTYLNRYTRRQYFRLWTAAWLFYALWLALGLAAASGNGALWLSALKIWCAGASASFLLWGGLRFLDLPVPQRLFAFFLLFVLVWSFVGGGLVGGPLLVSMPVFGLLGMSSAMNAGCFFRLRHRCRYLGAVLLVAGFLLWGLYLGSIPLLELNPRIEAVGFFVAAVVQLFIAVSMIILVLEEAHASKELALQEIESHKTEAATLRTRVVSTEERYRSLFEQASEGIIITAAEDLRILELNQTAKRLLGVDAGGDMPRLDQFIRLKSPISVGGTPGAAWLDSLRQEHRVTLVRRDGSTLPVEIDGARVEFEGEEAIQLFVRELTERAQLEQQLRQAEKLSALGQMISGVAHELNNPLAIIKGSLELILARQTLPAETRDGLKKVAAESNRAAKLVGQFLSFARERPLQRRPGSLNEIARRVVDLHKVDPRIAGVEVTLALDPVLPELPVDADQVQQVLVNLVGNSLDALRETRRDGRLKISTESDGQHVWVRVEDNGPGVPESIQPRIFEPFFTTKEVGRGTGLGLSIAHSIMSDHQGRIFYRPSPEGGAGFVLEFPLAAEKSSVPEACVEADEANQRVAVPAGTRALVLDDEPRLAELLGQILEMLGYQATVRTSPEEALECLERTGFDVVLSDFRMPGLDGKAFFHEAVERRPELARRIVFLTGDVLTGETRAFLESTGTPHLRKPFEMDAIAQALAQVLHAESLAA